MNWPVQHNLTLTLHLERESTDAILVRRPEAETAPVWLPITQIEIAPERVGRRVMVTLPKWLAAAKGLIAKPDPNQGSLL